MKSYGCLSIYLGVKFEGGGQSDRVARVTVKRRDMHDPLEHPAPLSIDQTPNPSKG